MTSASCCRDFIEVITVSKTSDVVLDASMAVLSFSQLERYFLHPTFPESCQLGPYTSVLSMTYREHAKYPGKY